MRSKSGRSKFRSFLKQNVQLLKNLPATNCRAFRPASIIIFSFIYKSILGTKKVEEGKIEYVKNIVFTRQKYDSSKFCPL